MERINERYDGEKKRWRELVDSGATPRVDTPKVIAAAYAASSLPFQYFALTCAGLALPCAPSWSADQCG